MATSTFKKFQHPLQLLLSLLLFTVLCSCGSGKLCCQDLTPETEERYYCGQHESAVRKYVNSTIDDEEKRIRLEKFRDFYDDIKYCETIQCLESLIFSNPNFKAFSQLYALEHEIAEINSAIDSNKKKADMVLCGFRTAIDMIDANLTSRGY